MCRSKHRHGNRRRDIYHPDCGTQIVNYRKNRKRNRHEKKGLTKQCDVPTADKITNPDNIVQKQKTTAANSQILFGLSGFLFTKNVSRKRQTIRLTASVISTRRVTLLDDEASPVGGKSHIGNIDQHRQGKHNKTDPRKR